MQHPGDVAYDVRGCTGLYVMHMDMHMDMEAAPRLPVAIYVYVICISICVHHGGCR